MSVQAAAHQLAVRAIGTRCGRAATAARGRLEDGAGIGRVAAVGSNRVARLDGIGRVAALAGKTGAAGNGGVGRVGGVGRARRLGWGSIARSRRSAGSPAPKAPGPAGARERLPSTSPGPCPPTGTVAVGTIAGPATTRPA